MASTVLVMLVVLGCSSSEEPDWVPEAEALNVPQNYTKFIDRSGSFTIHYPNYWEPEYSELEDMEEWVKQELSDRSTDLDLSGMHFIFAAIDYTGRLDFSTNVNVMLERVPSEITLNEYHKSSKAVSRSVAKSWQLHSEQPVTLGGLGTYIQESSLAFSELTPGAEGRARSFQTALKRSGEGIIWVVTCTFESGNTSASDACATVVRTARLSN